MNIWLLPGFGEIVVILPKSAFRTCIFLNDNHVMAGCNFRMAVTAAPARNRRAGWNAENRASAAFTFADGALAPSPHKAR